MLSADSFNFPAERAAKTWMGSGGCAVTHAPRSPVCFPSCSSLPPAPACQSSLLAQAPGIHHWAFLLPFSLGMLVWGGLWLCQSQAVSSICWLLCPWLLWEHRKLCFQPVFSLPSHSASEATSHRAGPNNLNDSHSQIGSVTLKTFY